MIIKEYWVTAFLLFSLHVSAAFGNTDSISIKQYLEKHQLVRNQPLTIALINPYTCANSIEAYKMLQDQLAIERDTLFFVFEDIRRKEAEFTVKEIIKIKAANYRIITDKALFKALLQNDKAGYNYIIELNGMTIARKLSIVEWLNITRNQPAIPAKDSVLLDETLVSVDSESQLSFVNDSAALIYSFIYNKIYKYDIRTGKNIGILELTDHEGLVTELYKQIFEDDPNRHAYTMSERNKNISNRMFGHRHEIEFQQALVNGTKLYALARLSFPIADDMLEVQTLILVYDFNSFEFLDWYILDDNFPDNESWFVNVWRRTPAFVVNEQELILSLYGTPQGYQNRYPFLICIRLNNHKATFGPMLDFQLPPFFKRINTYYEWIGGNIFDFQGKRYLFVYQEPFIYSLQDTGKTWIKGFNENKREPKNNGEVALKVTFLVYDVFVTPEGLSVLCREERKDRIWKIDYDNSFREIRRNLYNVSEVGYGKLYKNKMYVIDDRKDEIYLFRYDLGEL